MLVLAIPGLIYYGSCALIPENPPSVESWRDYFYSIRRRYFVSFVCLTLAAVSAEIVALGNPVLVPFRGVQAAWLAAAIAGVLSASHRVQAGIAVWLIAVYVLVGLTIMLQPGSFAPP